MSVAGQVRGRTRTTPEQRSRDLPIVPIVPGHHPAASEGANEVSRNGSLSLNAVSADIWLLSAKIIIGCQFLGSLFAIPSFGDGFVDNEKMFLNISLTPLLASVTRGPGDPDRMCDSFSGDQDYSHTYK